ncbi:MAG TPA: hypothetical protein VLX92_06080 [Kofleriaceae bacterium]|nr:hypothetical protein [Kofleriaceae bacterium]
MKTTLVCALLVALVGTAAADRDKDKADALFKQGKKLMEKKQYAEACQAFEESNKLDAQIGTQLNIAHCYEEWGKLAHAYRAYQEALAEAKQVHDHRAGEIRERLDAVDKDVPRLAIKVPDGADTSSLGVTIDGAAVPEGKLGESQRVDPGPHVIEYEAGGKKKSTVVPVERGGKQQVVLELPSEEKPATTTTTTTTTKITEPEHHDAPADHPGRGQRVAGLAVGGAGLVAIGVSSVLALSARSTYKSALSAHCGGMTDMCDMTGLSETHSARSEANVATVVFAVGVAAVGGGAALYFLAPHSAAVREHAMYLVPTAAPDYAGLALGGRL